MKKIMRFIVLLSCMVLLSASCSYKESFVYNGNLKVNFVTDSLYFSFGKEPFSLKDTTIAVKVEIIGRPSHHPLSFRVSVDNSGTTAFEGSHFDHIDENRQIESGKSSAIVPVRIHRRNLDENRSYVIKLVLVPTKDLQLGVSEFRNLAICFNNTLDKPEWWYSLSEWLGEYDVRKYQKFIELYGGPISKKDIIENKYRILRVFKKVKEFFESEPAFGVIFPEAYWPV